MPQLRDSIDFANGNVRSLFNKIFYPTLLGMVFSMVFNLTDGIFVGRGIGPVALAAVNMIAPLFTLVGALALMFGTGGSVVASIHLSQNNNDAARIVATQSIGASTIIMLFVMIILLAFPDLVLRLFGCSETLLPHAKEYLMVIAPFMVINAIILTSGFFVRLDGSPKYAMTANIIGSTLNIFLDWLFIYPLEGGLWGAAMATGISMTVGATILIVYVASPRHNLHLVRVKVTTVRAWQHTLRNCGYMCKLGFSTALAQFAVAFMIICGNFVFISLEGDTAVAAFSVVCYMMPVVFMVYDAIAMAAQPIQSYNYGTGDMNRVRNALRVGILTGLAYAVFVVLLSTLGAEYIAFLFLDPAEPAYAMAVEGLRLFSIGFIPMVVNIVVMSYFQSIERVVPAMTISLLRGFVAILICYLTLPRIWGMEGAWLAVPASEIITFFVTLILLKRSTSQTH